MHECVLGCFSPIRLCSPMNCSPQGPLSREEKKKKKKKAKLPSPNTKYLSHENPLHFFLEVSYRASVSTLDSGTGVIVNEMIGITPSDLYL